jgi:hypothetical protein
MEDHEDHSPDQSIREIVWDMIQTQGSIRTLAWHIGLATGMPGVDEDDPDVVVAVAIGPAAPGVYEAVQAFAAGVAKILEGLLDSEQETIDGTTEEGRARLEEKRQEVAEMRRRAAEHIDLDEATGGDFAGSLEDALRKMLGQDGEEQ